MVALKTKFDGEKIEVPIELRGAAPVEVIVIYPSNALPERTHSIWDAIGKAPVKRSAEDIDAQVKALRDEWGDR